MSEINTASGLMIDEILTGLKKPQKTLPSKYFYDERGSRLFEEICELPEYYPTQTEVHILQSYMGEISQCLGSDVDLIEFGSGSSMKTRLLLDHLERLNTYYPVDISEVFLMRVAANIRAEYIDIKVVPIPTDYTRPFCIPGDEDGNRTIVFFPGSTIGNFTPGKASRFLGQHRTLMAPDGGMLIGVDRKKPIEILERAYNDSEGITAAFNLNMLVRLNRELDAGFDINQFHHKAFYNEDEGRIEMHLLSVSDQEIEIAGNSIRFSAGETIHTENSYKYTPEEVKELFGNGYRMEQMWSDESELFSIYFFRVI